MKVWICVDPYDDEMTLRGSEENCAFYDSDARPGGHGPSCHWARLVSVDALVIEKEDGAWPKWALDRIRYRGKAVEAMDALADLADPKPWKASQVEKI